MDETWLNGSRPPLVFCFKGEPTETDNLREAIGVVAGAQGTVV